MNSYELTKSRFRAPAAASNYPAAYGRSFRERREADCLRTVLRCVPARGHVLDLPCGTGRLLGLLAESGSQQITAADASGPMLEHAQKNWQTTRRSLRGPAPAVRFLQSDVMATGFPDGHFDAVICSRLFHHFSEAATRLRALTELGRISRGPIILSFFNSFAASAIKFRLKHFIRGTVPRDRIPIRLDVLSRDVRRAGLEIVSSHPVLWAISPMWYLILGRQQG